ncbi:bZIP transcription factor TGA10-like [Salvia splendens]|uniref:bZIP transcription factor TGA10-like n=1 Tax=Salvia splendens TaxID=180675 RepID=UPI001C271DCA|nr:bZIP transcription factor TGA10-like [Salvia splendens]
MRQHSLSILPPQPLHGEPNFTGVSSGSKKPFEASNPRNDVQEFASVVQREVNCQGLTSEQDVLKPTDLKTLKRLAQNREAAKKSRLKKKAYVQELESHVQELESHKIELDQLKLEIQNDGAQGILLGGNANAGEQGLAYTNIIPGAAQFDKAYARWLEEHHHLTVDLRGAVNDYRRLNEIGTATRNWLAHCDQIVALKRKALKNDVFHVFTGMWKAPAERCFMWMGGFRPSAAIKIALSQMEGLTEQQRAGLRGLHQSTNEAEEAISGGFERLDQCLTQTIVGNTLTVPPDVNTYMTQMSIATKQVSALQGVVTQGDSLRLQTLQELRLHLTIRQAAQCFLVISEYFNRLRSLSTLWLNRTRHD